MKEKKREETERQNSIATSENASADTNNDGALRILYETVPGRVLLRLLSARWVSRVCGAFLDSRLSVPMIKGFAERSGINMQDYLEYDFSSFNEFFTRRIRPEMRPIAAEPSILPSPATAGSVYTGYTTGL